MSAQPARSWPEIGGYQVLDQLSSGGMGEVLLARRRGAHGFEKLVALKTIRRDLRARQDLRTMFLDEANLMARLAHPAIAQVHDFGEESGTLYLAMEYVAGLSFAEVITHSGGPLPFSVAARMVADACRGLHAAHEATDAAGHPLGVVHRDVSPQNLILTFEGCVKILDFGIAWRRDREAPATEFGSLKGKPAYMAPEQTDGGNLDRRADLFAVGVVLYELLTGERLFSGDTIFQVVHAVHHQPILPPSERVGQIPHELDAVVLRALAREPGQRFETAAAMAAALEEIPAVHAGETLERFVDRALGAERRQHQGYLQSLLDEGGRSQRFGRPAGLVTGSAAGVASAMAATPVTRDEQALVPASRSWWHKRRYQSLIAATVTTGLVLAGAAWFRTPVTTTTATAAKSVVVSPPVSPTAPTRVPVTEVPPSAGPAVEPVPARTVGAPAEMPKTVAATRRKPGTHPRAKSAAAGALTTYGFVRVTADPFANVRIDGVLVGPTPLMHHSLPVGNHEIELLSPDTGAVLRRETIKIAAERLVTVHAP